MSDRIRLSNLTGQLAASWLLMLATLAAQQPESPSPPTQVPFVEGSTTLAVLPDTQYYSQKYPEHFEAQTRWIADQHRRRNIVYALHLGDIVQDDLPAEWDVARRCMGMLDGKVPYLLTPGNHDYRDGGRETHLSEYFPVVAVREWPSFGGVFEAGRLDNNFHLFEIGGQPWIAIGLEYGPRPEVIDWANSVLEQHRARRAIIVTHGYLFRDNQRFDHRQGEQRATPHGYAGDGADGQMLWDQLVRRHPEVMIVICGHVRTGGLGYRASEGDYGNTVHEMMVNYQKLPGGGRGYMRLLEFLPDGTTVQVRTFSPSTGKVRTSELEDFTFELQGATRTEPRGDTHPLRRAPIHRYSFDGEGEVLVDSAGNAPGRIDAPDGSARLDGRGKLILDSSEDGSGFGQLPASLVGGRTAVSLEAWVTPSAESYDWDPVIRFAGAAGADAIYYTFRTLQKHRAELIDDGHNEDVQSQVEARPGQTRHLVMTYDQSGRDGRPEITSYVDGVPTGQIETKIKLDRLELASGQIGPFAGAYDELRVYDYALGPEEVKGNYEAGPDQLRLADPSPSR